MRVRPWFLFGLGLAGAVAIACANGTATEEEDGGAFVEEEEDTGAPPSTSRDSSSPPTPPQRDAASTDDGSAGDGGVKLDGGDGGTTNPDGGSPTACMAPNTCIGATILTDVRGDTNADTATHTGSTSKWLKIRVSENNSNPIDGEKLKLKVTLTSPAGTNFDLRLYLPGDGSSQKCAGPDRSTTNTTGNDVTSIDWGEGAIANGSSDDRTVTVEVVHVSGTCAAGQTWSLLAEGNKL